jgi:uncharacterized protein (DUF1778 family)
VGYKGTDIDHVVIGPPGVFTRNTKNQIDNRVTVNEKGVYVNGQWTEYLRNSRHETQRASRLLTAACGSAVDVVEVIVVTARTKPVRMRRSPGGRHRLLGVRLTEEEERRIRQQAEGAGLSAQRFVVEAALSGSATAAAQRRRAQRDAERARLILASISNNVNQLAKWANTNHALPETFAACIDDIRRATSAVTDTTQRLGAAFEPER